MKRGIIFSIFTMVIGSLMLAQSAALQNQIAADKNELTAEGYTFIDGGDGNTSNDWVLQFDHHNFEKGNYYMVIMYIEGCPKCDPGMYFHNKVTDEVQYLEPNVERADGFVRGTYHVHQSIEAHGDIAVFAKSKKEVYTYAMLYYMWDMELDW